MLYTCVSDTGNGGVGVVTQIHRNVCTNVYTTRKTNHEGKRGEGTEKGNKH